MRVSTFDKIQAADRDSHVSEAQAVPVVPVSFAEIVERNSRFAYRVAYVVLRNCEDAEDVVQETFLKLYRTASWKTIRDERAFLARAVWRMAVERLPKRNAVPLDVEAVSRSHSPEAAAVHSNWTELVHQLMASLPEELRRPLALSALEELNSREIAEVMGIPEGTVRHRILRAREILKQKLEAMGGRRHAG
jgi:RNA polymerase sigma-70 factor (ECF subfamily)